MLKKLENELRHIYFEDFAKRNPLHIAAINGNIDIMRFLLKCNTLNINAPDSQKRTALNYACYNKHIEVAMLLKSNGAELREFPDMGAIFCKLGYEGDLEHLKLYLECGANIMMPDYDKRTVAHIAAAEGHDNIISFLLKETNYDLLQKDRWGHTPLDDCTDDIYDMLKAKYTTQELPISISTKTD
jgi:hypothetical protein